MAAFWLGTAGFVLCFLYDINSVKYQNRVIQKFFAAGCLCILGAVTVRLSSSLHFAAGNVGWRLAAAAGALLFAGLLVYTLFFALPFQKTYVEESTVREAYTEGVYGLCRHPGILWFAGLFLCLWGASGKGADGFFYLSMILWNLLYAAFQDVWTFPQTFSNYRQYQQSTPFLIPNPASIRKCLHTLR